MEAISAFVEAIQSVLVAPELLVARKVCSKELALQLQQASTNLTRELMDKLSEVSSLQGKIGKMEEEHGEEVSSYTTQVILQDGVIKELQSQVQDMLAQLNKPRMDTDSQTEGPVLLEAAVQAKPKMFAAGSMATVTRNDAECQVVSGSRGRGLSSDPSAALGPCSAASGGGMLLTPPKPAPSPVTKMRNGHSSCTSAVYSRAVSCGGANECSESDTTLSFDMAILKKKYARAVERIVELDETSTKLEFDNKELLALADMYRQRSELAIHARDELRTKLDQMVHHKMRRASASSYGSLQATPDCVAASAYVSSGIPKPCSAPTAEPRPPGKDLLAPSMLNFDELDEQAKRSTDEILSKSQAEESLDGYSPAEKQMKIEKQVTNELSAKPLEKRVGLNTSQKTGAKDDASSLVDTGHSTNVALASVSKQTVRARCMRMTNGPGGPGGHASKLGVQACGEAHAEASQAEACAGGPHSTDGGTCTQKGIYGDDRCSVSTSGCELDAHPSPRDHPSKQEASKTGANKILSSILSKVPGRSSQKKDSLDPIQKGKMLWMKDQGTKDQGREAC